MIGMFAFLYFIIALEVVWDSYHELELNMSPNYEGSNLARIIFGAVYWLVFPIAYNDITVWQWLLIPPMVMLNYWFFFDLWLNLVRRSVGQKKSLYYLGENSKLDVWQKEHGGAKLWFYLKGIGAIVMVCIFNLLNPI